MGRECMAASFIVGLEACSPYLDWNKVLHTPRPVRSSYHVTSFVINTGLVIHNLEPSLEVSKEDDTRNRWKSSAEGTCF